MIRLKPSHLYFNSGNTLLDGRYQSIFEECIRVKYDLPRKKIISKIKSICSEFADYSDYIIERLKFDIDDYTESLRSRHPNNQLVFRNIKQLEQILSYLDKEKETLDKIISFPRMFVSEEGFVLFDRLHNEFKDNQNTLANFSFIYRKMYLEGFIHPDIRPVAFIEWLSDNYNIAISEVKTLDRCTTSTKETLYGKIKLLVKQEIQVKKENVV